MGVLTVLGVLSVLSSLFMVVYVSITNRNAVRKMDKNQ